MHSIISCITGKLLTTHFFNASVKIVGHGLLFITTGHVYPKRGSPNTSVLHVLLVVPKSCLLDLLIIHSSSDILLSFILYLNPVFRLLAFLHGCCGYIHMYGYN